MSDFTLENYARPTLETPNGEQRILMHSCCAPCSGEVMDAMAASGIDDDFFHNPNIHRAPSTSCARRRISGAEKLGMSLWDADYDTDNWFGACAAWSRNPSGVPVAPCILTRASSVRFVWRKTDSI